MGVEGKALRLGNSVALEATCWLCYDSGLELRIGLLKRAFTSGILEVGDCAVDWATRAPSPLNEPDCSPHPFDVMAIYALYQTVEQ